MVHTPPPVPASQIFIYGRSSDPISPSNDSSTESVTPKGNLKPRKNPNNLVTNVPIEPDLDPILLDYSSSDSSESSDDEYYK